MHPDRARELLAAERRRLEHALSHRGRQDDGEQSDPFFDAANLAADLYEAELDEGLEEDLLGELAGVERAERRLQAGTYGYSIRSGQQIADARLEILPTAELTTEEEEAA
jgi:RNA polymerase-binding transcription factor